MLYWIRPNSQYSVKPDNLGGSSWKRSTGNEGLSRMRLQVVLRMEGKHEAA